MHEGGEEEGRLRIDRWTGGGGLVGWRKERELGGEQVAETRVRVRVTGYHSVGLGAGDWLSDSW